MIIRELKRSDTKQLRKLFEGLHIRFHRQKLMTKKFLAFVQYKNSHAKIKKDLSEIFAPKKYKVFIAEEKGKLIGYASGKIVEKPDYISDREGFIDELYVEEDYRGIGVGRKLYEKLVEYFRKEKCTHLSLNTYAINKKAIAIYKKWGFMEFDLNLRKLI